ncbi:MOP superfamily flippase transporter [Liquorilactobacillus aquaticus DSM 21051]|uniref:MOP superfamily flippase transporter n=1 Tax=Liquorilactobacillus aquaticus DSM 21051 TaxID=1423725 RepID=A0A0R2D0J2_9LACO|nr:oligosaccharide flippase family protein [Liquorilactobacillus aquaticus]KRM96890.1 MOP superfamily flippase transporter [Liquorilactobacillus aquaticus DSM 21051]
MKIFKNYFYNAGYQLLAMILPLVTAPYVTRVLGATNIGINATTNANIQYFVLFGSIGIALYGNREIAAIRDDRHEMSKTFWEIQLLKTITISITYLLFLGVLMLLHRYQFYMLIQSLYIIAAGVDISWLYMGIEDFRKTVLRNTFVKILSIILIFIFVKERNDLWAYILILAGSVLLGNATLWPYLRKTLTKVKFSELNIWRHFRPSITFFVPQVAVQVYLILNKSMLGLLGPVSSSGFYDRADTIVKLILSLATATGTVMLPHVTNAFSRGDNKRVNHYLVESFDFVSFIAIPMACGLAGISIKLGPFFYGTEFIPVGRAMLLESVIIIFIAWSNVIGQQFLLPTNRIKSYSSSVILGAVVNIICNVPFIYFGGLYGAMAATILSELSVTSYQIWKIKNLISLKQLFVNVPKYLLAGLVMFAVVFKLNNSVHFYVISLIWQILLGVFIYGGMLLLLRPTILDKIKKIVSNFRSQHR